MKYMKVFYDWLEGMEALDYTERGRLFTALLEYARGEEASALEGNEKFIFPVFRSQIDRDQAKYGEYLGRQRENGKKGGRPSACNPKENPWVFSETQKSQDKDEDKDKEKEKDYNKDEDDDKDFPARAREEREGHVVGVVVDGGVFGFSQRAREELAQFQSELGEEVCRKALEAAQDAGRTTWSYVRGILRRKRDQGVRSGADWDRVERERIEQERERERQAGPRRGRVKSCQPGDNFQPTPERASRNAEWLEQFLREQSVWEGNETGVRAGEGG